MKAKQLALLVVILLVLGGAAAWIYSGGNSAWKQADTQAGAKVFPELVAGNVATVRIKGSLDGKAGTVTLERKGSDWTVKEREGYTADAGKIAGLLGKLADLKVTQTEAIAETLRPRLKLAAAGQADGGVELALLDGSGKEMGSVIAGKTIDRKSDIPGATKDIPTGRYLLKPATPTTALAINDPLNDLDANPRTWINTTFLKPERVKSLKFNAGGQERFALARNEEAEMAWALKDPAKGEELDTSRAQDEANGIAGITVVDLVPGAKPEELGLTGGDVLSAETFDGLTYTLTFGKKDGDNRYVQVGVNGKPERSSERTPGKDEKPEDRAKLDKEYQDKIAAFNARVTREQAMDKKVFLVADASAAPLLLDRAKLMKQKQVTAQPEISGLQKYEKKAAPAKK